MTTYYDRETEVKTYKYNKHTGTHTLLTNYYDRENFLGEAANHTD